MSDPKSGLPGSQSTASDTREQSRAESHPVPVLVRATAEWAWRLVVIAVAVFILVWVAKKFDEVVIPVALAILASAFLLPVVDWLDRRGLHRGVAVAITLLVALGAVAGVLTFIVDQFIDGFPALTSQATNTVATVKHWLVHGPFGVKEGQLDHIGNDIINFMQRNQDKVTTGAIATATTITRLATGLLLTVFLTIFFLFGGGQVWRFITKVVPAHRRDDVRIAGRAGFATVVGYVRATIAVALVDAIGIGIGLAALQVPLALPLASLVFIGAFIPIVGALVTGALAVLVALVTHGWIAAVIALAVVVAVMQVESHVLQPFLLGRSVRVHPVAVVLGIAAGIVSGGIVGGLLAVPIIAFVNTAVRSLHMTTRAAGVTTGDSVQMPSSDLGDVGENSLGGPEIADIVESAIADEDSENSSSDTPPK